MAQAYECDRCHELFVFWPKPWGHIKFDWDMKVITKKPGSPDPDLCMTCYLAVLDRMVMAMKGFIELGKEESN